MTHAWPWEELVCVMTAVANVALWGYSAGRVTQLVRDVELRVSALERWRDKHSD